MPPPGGVTITTLHSQRFVANRGATVGGSLNLVASIATQLLMRFIERKASQRIMIKLGQTETRSIARMARRTVLSTILGKLAKVDIRMAVMTTCAARARTAATKRVDLLQGAMTG